MDRERVGTEVAGVIDHTLLKPEATADDIRKLCGEAREYGFASVCVNPSFVPLAAELLQGSSVRVCTVVGFPLGAHRSEAKAYEAELAVRQGAREVDMVVDIGALKGGDIGAVEREVAAVVASARRAGKDTVVKVIIETCLLTDREKEEACRAVRRAGADFVKTSTGFSSGGATAEDVALLKKAGEGLLVKASGGIRTWADFQAMRRAGADRIGTSGGVRIVAETLASAED